MNHNAVSKFFFLVLFLVPSLSGISNESKIIQAEKTLVFCNTVSVLQQAYLKAVLSQEKELQALYVALDNAENKLEYTTKKLELANHYGDEMARVKDLERSYKMEGDGLEIQAEVVAYVSECRREIGRLELFVKSFSEYITSNRYLNDIEKSERKIIVQKIDEEIDILKGSIRKMQTFIGAAEKNAENTILENHDLKNILIPMFDDLQFVSSLVHDLELEDDLTEKITLIKDKRIRISQEIIDSQKVVKYLMSDEDGGHIYRDFYLRYQTLLTNVQVLIESGTLNDEDRLLRIYNNRIGLDKLESAYNMVRG